MAGLVQAYRGRYYNASSASTKLDINSILAGCSAVETEANNIDEISNSINNSASYLTREVFSINGETVSKDIDEACTEIISVQSSIMDAVAQIRINAINAYNSIQTQLNNEAQSLDQAEIRRRSKL